MVWYLVWSDLYMKAWKNYYFELWIDSGIWLRTTTNQLNKMQVYFELELEWIYTDIWSWHWIGGYLIHVVTFWSGRYRLLTLKLFWHWIEGYSILVVTFWSGHWQHLNLNYFDRWTIELITQSTQLSIHINSILNYI